MKFLHYHLRRKFSYNSRDTIYALASGFGRSSVAVIRISGSNSKNVLTLLSKNSEEYDNIKSVLSNSNYQLVESLKLRKRITLESHFAYYRTLHNPFNSFSIIDHVLLLYFKNPRSFTGEDVIEIQCHGGTAIKEELFDVLSKLSGFRNAEPGEFTKRAFLNKKMNLFQVEALAGIINSETNQQKELNLKLFDGTNLKRLEDIRKSLIKCLAHSEAYIDFEEEENDVNTELFEEIGSQIDEIIKKLEDCLFQFKNLNSTNEKINISIIGPPNAGKSSLMNLLTKKETSIVTNIPGTTRDIVTSTLNLGGININLNDTAGIRKTEDFVEKIGIMKTHEIMLKSIVQCLILDGKELELRGKFQIKENELVLDDDYFKDTKLNNLEELENQKVLIIINKVELMENFYFKEKNKLKIFQFQGKKYDFVPISILENFNINFLLETLISKIEMQKLKTIVSIKTEDCLIVKERQRELVDEILKHLKIFRYSDKSIDMRVQELRDSIKAFGRLLGKIDVEEILDVVFKDFCIGK